MKPPLRIPLLLLAGALMAPLVALENDGPRRDQLRRLRGAIRAFTQINTEQPLTKLSQLVEENILDGPASLMRPGNTAVPPRAELDARSDYTFETPAGVVDLVVRERAPLAGEREVLAIFKDGTIRPLAIGAAVADAPPVSAPPRPVEPRSTPPPASSGSSGNSGLIGTPVTSPAPRETPASPTRSVAAPSNTAMRGAPTADEEAEMAKARQFLLQKAEAADSPVETTAASATSAASAAASPGAMRAMRLEDLPLAGLSETASPPNRAAPIVTFNRNPQEVSPEVQERFNTALKAAVTAENKGQWAAASGYYRAALALRPDSTMALLGHAEVLDRQGLIAASIELYQRARAIAPTAPGIALKLAELHANAGDLSSAEKEAERAVLAEPASGLALSWLGTVEMLQGERDMSEGTFRRAVQLDPRVAEQRYQTGVSLLAAGRAQRAAPEIVSALMMKPDHRGALFTAAECYLALGNRDRSMAYFRRYLELEPTGAQADRARERLRESAKPVANDGGAGKRIGDWLAGRPVTLPGKSEPIKPIFGGASATTGQGSSAASATSVATPPPVSVVSPPAASSSPPAGTPGDLVATLTAWLNAVKQSPGSPNASAGPAPTPQQLGEIQARVDAFIEQEARAGRYQTSAQVINALMELERLLRNRADSSTAVITSPSFTPPPSDASAAASVLDTIAKANAASATPAARPIQATPGPSLAPGAAPSPAPSSPAGTSGAVFSQLVFGQPASDMKLTDDISDWAYNQAKAAGDFGRMIKIDLSRGRLSRKSNGIGSEKNNEDKFYESALYYQQKKLGLGNVPEVAYTLNDIGVAYTESQTYGAAEDAFKRAQQVWEAMAPTDAALRGDYAVMVQNFSVLREKQGNTAEAAQLKAQADSIRGRLGGSSSGAAGAPSTPASPPQMGNAPSSPSVAPAGMLARSGSPPSKPKWGVTHQLVMGLPWPSVTQSERKLRTAVEAAEATPDQRLVLALNDLAGWYRGQRRLEDAYNTYQRVHSLQVQRGLEHHHDLALTHNDLGVVASEAGWPTAAEPEFKKAIEIWEKRWDGPLPTEDHAVTLHNYAAMLEKVGRKGEAAGFEAQAAEMMETRRKAMEFE